MSLLNIASSAPAENTPGLVVQYFQAKVGPSGFPSMEGKKPFFVRVDKQVDFPSVDGEFYNTHLSENFVAVWIGSLKVETAGETTFYLNVDDGAQLSIDGKVILEDICTNGMSEKSVKVDLAAGEHALKIQFYQKGGGAGVLLSLAMDWPGGKEGADSRQGVVA